MHHPGGGGDSDADAVLAGFTAVPGNVLAADPVVRAAVSVVKGFKSPLPPGNSDGSTPLQLVHDL